MATPQYFHTVIESPVGGDTTRYDRLFHARDASEWNQTNEATAAEQIIAQACTIKGWKFELTTAPGSGKSHTFVIRKNGVDQDGSGGTPDTRVTISDTATTGSSTFSLSAVAGDYFTAKRSGSGTPAGPGVTKRTVEILGTTGGQFSMFAGTWTAITITTTKAYFPFHVTRDDPGNETAARSIVPLAFTLKAIYVRFDSNAAGSAGNGWRVSVFKNGSEQASSEFTVEGATRIGNVTGLSIAYAVDDTMSIQVEKVGTPTGSSHFNIALLGEATDGYSILAAGTDDNAFTSSQYTSPQDHTVSLTGLNSTEANRYAKAYGALTLSAFRAKCETAPGSGQSYTTALRKAGADVSTITISDTATTGTASDTVAYSANDTLAIRLIRSASAAVTDPPWTWTAALFVTPVVTEYTLVADAATVTISAQAATLSLSKRITADASTITISAALVDLLASSAGFTAHGILRGAHQDSVNLPFQVLRLPAVHPVSGTPSISVKLRKSDTSTGEWKAKLVYYGPPSVEEEEPPETGGEGPDGVNPPDGENLCNIKNPLLIAELETDEGRKWYSANVEIDDPAGYYGGKKQPRLLRTGAVTRSLSDWYGNFESGSSTVEISDTDGVIRQLWLTNKFFNRELALWMIDDPARRQQLDWRMIQRFLVRRVKPLGDLIFQLEMQDWLGALLKAFSDKKKLPNRIFSTDTNDRIPPEQIGKSLQVIYGECSDGSSGVGVVPAQYIGHRYIPVDGRDWGEFHIAIGEVDVVDIFAGNSTGTNRAHWPTSSYGVGFLVPDTPSWNVRFGPVKTRTLGDGVEHTVIYVQGPQWDWARSGQVPITVNVMGRKDANGLMIDSLPLQILDFLTNFVLQNTTGPSLSIPTFGSSETSIYSMIDAESFVTAHETSSTRMGATGSPFTPYRGAWVLGSDGNQITLADWLRGALVSSDLDLGVNMKGQLFASMLDTSLEIVKRFRDHREIIKDTHNIDIDIELLSNVIRYWYAKRYITPLEQPTPEEGVRLPPDAKAEDWYSGTQELRDQASIDALRDEEKILELELPFVRDADTADDVVAHRMARSKDAPIFGSFNSNLCPLDVELGRVIGDTHFAGLGPTGWHDQRLRTRKLVLNPNDFTAGSDPNNNFQVTLTGHDITDLDA